MLGDVRFAIEIRAQRAHLSKGCGRGDIGRSWLEIFVADPTGIGVGGADAGETVFLLEQCDFGGVDGLRYDVGVGGGGREHVGDGNADEGGGRGLGDGGAN